MSTIVNNDKLTFILTTYGLQRIAEAMEDESVSLNISKIKVGDANGDYYVPTEDVTELVHPIENGSFYVLDKDLLEDQLTVSFHTVFPENFGNCDIREVGLYESTEYEGDKLFAIGTQQPFVKPSLDDNYLISVDYYIFLKSANLATVYDQIILDPDNQIVTRQELEDLMRDILFTQSNLSKQIGDNSHIIGLNRSATLYELVTRTTENYGYTATYENYATLLNYVNPSSVFGYWIFNYPRRNTATNSITDISKNKYNFSSNLSINLYDRVYSGFMPMLNFNENDYFYLNAQAPLVLVDEEGQDLPFTMIFALTPHQLTSTRTILASSNYATKTHAFEVNELSNGAIQIRLFSSPTDYMTFTSGLGLIKENESHSLILSYDNISRSFTTYLNGEKISLTKEVTGTYSHMNISPTTLYSFTYTPFEVIYSNKEAEPFTVTNLFNKDGSSYSGTEWTTKNGKIFFGNTEAIYDSSKNTESGTLYAFSETDTVLGTHTIYTREVNINANTKLYNADFSLYQGSEYTIVLSGTSYIIQYVEDETRLTLNRKSTLDVPSKNLYAWIFNKQPVYIWANKSVNPTLLLNSDGNLYNGTEWTLNNGVILYKGTGQAVYASAHNINIQTLGTIASYIINSQGAIDQTIDSNVGLVAIIKEGLTDDQERTFALELEAGMGKNPCFTK